jgi:membrane-associated phospholipid phosphatase
MADAPALAALAGRWLHFDAVRPRLALRHELRRTWGVRPSRVLLCVLPCALFWGRTAWCECELLAPWQRVGASLGQVSEPLPLGLAGSAFVFPLAMAPTGADQRLRVLAQHQLGGAPDLEHVSLFAPYLLAGGLLVAESASAAFHACSIERPIAAVLQAMAGGVMFTLLSKWMVGREWPNQGRDPAAPDRLSHPERAQHFTPFHFRAGAWPSGHTLSMFAAAAAFRASEPELGALGWLGYPLALGVGAGMWLNDRHWASDVLSGGMLGEAIGASVGQSFATSADAPRNAASARSEDGIFTVSPLPNGVWLTWSGTF